MVQIASVPPAFEMKKTPGPVVAFMFIAMERSSGVSLDDRRDVSIASIAPAAAGVLGQKR
jgi:hypothetical protein